MHIFISVGEPSGDLHASKLMGELRRRYPDARFTGFGGPLMQAAGCEIVYPLTNLAVMGILKVIPLLLQFWRLARMAREYLKTTRPDAVVVIDFPGFNFWVARAGRKLGIPVFYYMPPQLWAWAPWRIRRIRKWVDEVLCALYFEYEWFRRRGVNVTWVGHPFFDEVCDRDLDEDFVLRHCRVDETGALANTVAILPGSRRQEVDENFPVQLDVMRRLARQVLGLKFLIACYSAPQRDKCAELLATRAPELDCELCVGRTSEILEVADVCLMVSGSVSLEVLARGTPAVVLYRYPLHMRWPVYFLKTCRYITLPNLIAGRELFPEFLSCGNPERDVVGMTRHLVHWLQHPDDYTRLVQQVTALADQVARPGASAQAAEAIWASMERRKTLSLTQPSLKSAALPPRAAG